jgi:hypothetical protein
MRIQKREDIKAFGEERIQFTGADALSLEEKINNLERRRDKHTIKAIQNDAKKCHEDLGLFIGGSLMRAGLNL